MAADRGYSTMFKLGLGALTFTSALGIYNSWGDAASVAFVLAADTALIVLLLLCLHQFEQGGRGRDTTMIKAAVWALTTLFTAMFSVYPSKVAAPLVVVGSLVFLHLRGQYADLLKMAFGVMACEAALAHHHHHAQGGDAGSLATFVFVAYVCFVTLTWLFLRRFDGRARGARQ